MKRTPSQDRAIQKLIRKAWQAAAGYDLAYEDEYEWKRFKVEPIGRTLSVVIELGRIGDEGTAASVFCRTRGHAFVGPRGGITYYERSGTRRRARYGHEPFYAHLRGGSR